MGLLRGIRLWTGQNIVAIDPSSLLNQLIYSIDAYTVIVYTLLYIHIHIQQLYTHAWCVL